MNVCDRLTSGSREARPRADVFVCFSVFILPSLFFFLLLLGLSLLLFCQFVLLPFDSPVTVHSPTLPAPLLPVLAGIKYKRRAGHEGTLPLPALGRKRQEIECTRPVWATEEVLDHLGLCK